MILLKNKQYYYWNKKSVSPWIKYNNEMNYKFENISKILFENIRLKKNQSVLDIGCCKGGSGFALSKTNTKGNTYLIDTFDGPKIKENLISKNHYVFSDIDYGLV